MKIACCVPRRISSFIEMNRLAKFLVVGASTSTSTMSSDANNAGDEQQEEDNDLVKVETIENVRLIGINRPNKRNCVNHATAKQLVNVFEQFQQDSSVDSAVLYGEGGTFCAGYDLSEVASGSASQLLHNFKHKSSDFRPMGPSMMRFDKLIIAAVDGAAVAGGLELACMCDLRVADETAIFGVFCRRFGVPLIDGGTVRLPKLIGLSRALDMILTGREINVKTAFEWGLVNRIVPTGTALGQAIKLAQTITKHPKKCTQADKRSAYYSAFEAKSWSDAFDFEFSNGIPVVLEESEKGASRFINEGIGKQGSFNAFRPPHEPKSKV